jgi:hypothetical protein
MVNSPHKDSSLLTNNCNSLQLWSPTNDDETITQVPQILLSNQPKEENNPMVLEITSYYKSLSFFS